MNSQRVLSTRDNAIGFSTSIGFSFLFRIQNRHIRLCKETFRCQCDLAGDTLFDDIRLQ